MHINGRVYGPDCMPESLQTVKLVPLARLGLVDLELHVLSNSVGSTTDDDHHRSNEDA